MENCQDDYDFEDCDGPSEIDEYEEALMNCGLDRQGFCSMAGSEYCDWDCPFNQ